MTQTQHTTRSCTSSCSSSDLQHAQQRRRRQMSKQFAAILLLLLISCSATLAAAAAAAATAQQSRFFYTAAAANSQGKARPQRQTNDAADVAAADATSCCQGAVAASAEPVTIALELGNVTADYSETDGSGESSKETFKRSVARAAIRNATPASCSPQPTIVELKPLTEQVAEQTAGNVYYSPACTRINRCNGCCGSTLISCQPTQVETLQLRVRKVERIGASSKRGYAIVNVDQHLACRCDCRIKAEDCNAYQEYRKDLCRCECQNTDERVKCQDQTDNKYWDDANCTCACRYNQSCTTGTVFDETQCKCTDPSAVSTDLTDRRRFIVQAVAVEEDNSTLYSV